MAAPPSATVALVAVVGVTTMTPTLATWLALTSQSSSTQAHHTQQAGFWPLFAAQPISPQMSLVSNDQIQVNILISAVKRSICFAITEKAPTRALSWLKAPTSAFTFKTLLRHYAKRALTPRSLNVKLGPRHNYHKGRAAIRHYAN